MRRVPSRFQRWFSRRTPLQGSMLVGDVRAAGSGAGWTRGLVFPILIAVVAAIVWRAGRHAAEVAATPAEIEAFVRETVAKDRLTDLDPLIASGLLRRLPEGTPYRLEVHEGDGGPGADGSATHVVVLLVDGQERVALRCRFDTDPARRAIVGVFDPPR